MHCYNQTLAIILTVLALHIRMVFHSFNMKTMHLVSLTHSVRVGEVGRRCGVWLQLRVCKTLFPMFLYSIITSCTCIYSEQLTIAMRNEAVSMLCKYSLPTVAVSVVQMDQRIVISFLHS